MRHFRLSDESAKMSDVKPRDSRITVRLSAKLRSRLRDAVRRGGTRESDFVRAAVEGRLAEQDRAATAYEHAKRAGLIGAVRGASSDLSTNPRHFDGFGGS
jgi:Arc/MetJ-type ribon-helix-helix transcriptional regulator